MHELRLLNPVALIAVTLLTISVLTASTAGTLTSSTNAALSWLITHRSSDGSYGGCTEIQTAPAAYALWLSYHNAPNVTVSYNFLKNQMDNSTTYFWRGGACSLNETDIPGEILYSFDASNNLAMLNMAFVGPKLLGFQQSNGGFLGYFDSSMNKQVTSTIDTSMALWGLMHAQAISASSQTSAVNYILSLQNSDGSFNLTNTVRSTSLYSLGPEPISLTAIALRVLKDAGLTTSNSHIVSALNYLNNAAATNFGGHVYAASIATLDFMAFNETTNASSAANFIISHQNLDGGFADSIRSSTTSNAIDTGWATIALETAQAIGSVGGKTVQTEMTVWLPSIAAILVAGSIVGAFLKVRGSRNAFSGKQVLATSVFQSLR